MLFHYTDLNAVQSILVNSKLWLTDYNFLNDKEELKAGYEYLIEALEHFDDYPEECSTACINAIKSSIRFLSEHERLPEQKYCIFVSSFSLAPDSLTQWRSYGMFSVEFNKDSLIASNRLSNLFLLECKYILDKNDALDDANQIIKDEIIPRLMITYKKTRRFLNVELSYLVDLFALSFKHAAFYEEQEERIVMVFPPDDDLIKFRAKGNILIPYVELPFPTSSIDSVKIGPIDNQELSAQSLYLLTDQVSRKVRELNKNSDFAIAVETSDLPYRSI